MFYYIHSLYSWLLLLHPVLDTTLMLSDVAIHSPPVVPSVRCTVGQEEGCDPTEVDTDTDQGKTSTLETIKLVFYTARVWAVTAFLVRSAASAASRDV